MLQYEDNRLGFWSLVLETVAAFTINRSSFSLNRISISTDFDDEITTVEMIRSTYNTLNTITMSNMNLNIQGDVLDDFDLGTNLIVDNVVFGKESFIHSK